MKSTLPAYAALTLLITNVFATDTFKPGDIRQTDSVVSAYPSLQDGVLSIPRVDTPQQISKYLNVKLSATKEGNWTLDSYRESGAYTYAPVETVELIEVNTLPKQVFFTCAWTIFCLRSTRPCIFTTGQQNLCCSGQ